MWTHIKPDQLDAIATLGNSIHLDFFEDPKVLFERTKLYPAGCFVYAEGGAYLGYAVSHPWIMGSPPPLNSLLDQLPSKPTTYYIHDVALAVECRNRGLASQIVQLIIDRARSQNFHNVTLVAVNNSVEFWIKNGFSIVEDQSLTDKLASYGNDAHFMVRKL